MAHSAPPLSPTSPLGCKYGYNRRPPLNGGKQSHAKSNTTPHSPTLTPPSPSPHQPPQPPNHRTESLRPSRLPQEHPQGPQPVEAAVEDEALRRRGDEAPGVVGPVRRPLVQRRVPALPELGLGSGQGDRTEMNLLSLFVGTALQHRLGDQAAVCSQKTPFFHSNHASLNRLDLN